MWVDLRIFRSSLYIYQSLQSKSRLQEQQKCAFAIWSRWSLAVAELCVRGWSKFDREAILFYLLICITSQRSNSTEITNTHSSMHTETPRTTSTTHTQTYLLVIIKACWQNHCQPTHMKTRWQQFMHSANTTERQVQPATTHHRPHMTAEWLCTL